ncbi:low temperature requirement protein A [Micromonospora sp. WMMC241]|uniref:low temperature requirement protein A n=1 Tax=Micromonospora sp. WMMC241 TaxID=3015159 RepID=UPI0022B70159|nr:low temperature requirement protein A [Micromonospora sp. WMMC241]MCZ7438150.1 low temperature requirement protein A [Micromonospora sp. WMMC241]
MSSLPRVRRSRWAMPVAPGSRVTRLELFYDVIFVFAFLNVTALVARHLSWLGLLAGAMVVALLWWCWTGFAALGNVVRADHGVLPLLGFGIMAAVFVLAVTLPQAFVDQPGDLSGPAVFAAAYLVVRVLTVAGFAFVFTPARQNRRQILVTALPPLVAGALVVASVTVSWWIPADAVLTVRLALWAAALVVEYAVGLFLPYARWTLPSAGHWAERHGLIVLIALGEAVISLGFGPGQFDRLALTAMVLVACVLGIALIAALWWLHFDSLSSRVEQVLHATRDEARIPLARDVYTYLHLLLVLGVVATALGLKLLVEAIAAPRPVPPITNIILHAGVALFLLAAAAVARRTFHGSGRTRLVAGLVVAGLAVPAIVIPPLVDLGLLVAVCGALALVQRLTGDRRGIKARARQEEQAAEEAVSAWRRQHL